MEYYHSRRNIDTAHTRESLGYSARDNPGLLGRAEAA